ncbi:hypothetical protein BDV24DRAFT_11417 [Aspergillus arachidicola]|uniref:Uncharacterized protein n=1 Tax=Aspergillus arachidicola TaxID=656916 RepID=A0A5N6XS88_9EURO|nr:hypothetical protein BDV24DRAFT_11417 [Aspergillus arachidicola]
MFDHGCPWSSLNGGLVTEHSTSLPQTRTIHCSTDCILPRCGTPIPIMFSSCWAIRNPRECSSSEVSCLLSRRYHIHWEYKPSFGLEYESSRQSSDGFHNPFSSDFVWVGRARQPRKTLRLGPTRTTWILFASPPRNERVLTPDTTRR